MGVTKEKMKKVTKKTTEKSQLADSKQKVKDSKQAATSKKYIRKGAKSCKANQPGTSKQSRLKLTGRQRLQVKKSSPLMKLTGRR